MQLCANTKSKRESQLERPLGKGKSNQRLCCLQEAHICSSLIYNLVPLLPRSVYLMIAKTLSLIHLAYYKLTHHKKKQVICGWIILPNVVCLVVRDTDETSLRSEHSQLPMAFCHHQHHLYSLYALSPCIEMAACFIGNHHSPQSHNYIINKQ